MHLLEGEGVSRNFGGLLAVSEVDFYVDEGEILGLIGPNGAGKTTLFNLISAALKPSAGRIHYKGVDITGLPPFRICRLGVARTFQTVKVFGDSTVLKNVMVGSLFGTGKKRVKTAEAERNAEQALELVGMFDLRDTLAGDLTLAQQKRLELARALATGPELLLLDELREPALRSAVEMASCDLIGRCVGQPLSRWFGGCFRRRVPLTIRVPSGPTVQVAQISRELAQQGFHSQVILASGEPEQDVRMIELIRRNVGDHIRLRLDGQARYDMHTARDLCVELEYAQLECFVDPLLVMELHELATLARQVNVPIGACRALRSPADVLLLARLGSIHAAVLDVQNVGGLTSARKCAAVAEAADVSVSLGCGSWAGVAAGAMAQLAAAMPVLRAANECTYETLNHHLLLDTPEVVDGLVAVPQGPGLGVRPDRAQIERLQAG